MRLIEKDMVGLGLGYGESVVRRSANALTIVQKLASLPIMNWLVPAVLFGVIAATHLWSLMRYPAPFVDEAWFAGRAWALIKNGQAFGTMDRGVFDRYEGYWTYFQLIPTFLQSIPLRLTNEPTLLPLRLVCLFFAMILLGAVYVIGIRIGGRSLGLLSVLLTAGSGAFFQSAHLARYDILAAAFGFAAIALYLNQPRPGLGLSLLSGLCVGIAFEIHPNSIIYGPVVLALYINDRGRSCFRHRDFWGFLLGVGIGLLFYATIHILPYPQTYFALNHLVYGPTHIPPLLTLDLRVMIQAFVDTLFVLSRDYLLLLPLTALAARALVLSHNQIDRRVLIICAILTTGFAFLIRNKLYYYDILLAPAIALGIATIWLDFRRQHWGEPPQSYFRASIVLAVIAISIYPNLHLLQSDSFRVYQYVQSRINRTIQPADSIMGSQTFWFGLNDHPYYSWEQLIYYQRYAPGSKLEQGFNAFRPNIFLVDEHLDEYISDNNEGTEYWQQLRLSRTELDSFLEKHAHLLESFDGKDYGLVRIYRIDW